MEEMMGGEVIALRDSSELQKSGPVYGSTQPSGSWVPKSWFTDPFALLDSLGLGYKASPSSLSYDTLKSMSENNVIIAAILLTRVHQVASFCRPQRNKYSIGFKISHRDESKKLSSEDMATIKHIENFLLYTGNEYSEDRDDFETFVKKVVRDRLTYDQMCSEIVYKYSGKPYEFHAVPGATIRLASPKKNKGTPMTKEEARTGVKYIQIIDGQVVTQYTNKEMTMSCANPRTDLRSWGYGYSELEMLIRTVTQHLWAEEWNRKVFSQGSTTKGILNLKGNIPPQQLDAFKRQWMTQISGVSNAWRTPIINSNEDLQWINLQPTNNDMGYEEWMHYLIKVACAIYLIDPAEINFDLRASSGVRPQFMSTNETQQKMSQDRGLRPLLRHVERHLNRSIIWRIDPNFVFEFVGVDAKTEAEAIDLRLKELQTYKTLNEVRAAEQLPPVKYGDIVPNPSYIGYRNQKDMMAQQQAQMGAMGGGGMPPGGQPPGEEGGDKDQKDAQERIGAELKGKHHSSSSEASTHVPDRYHQPEEDWESTYNAGFTQNDLRKATEAFDDLLLDD